MARAHPRAACDGDGLARGSYGGEQGGERVGVARSAVRDVVRIPDGIDEKRVNWPQHEVNPGGSRTLHRRCWRRRPLGQVDQRTLSACTPVRRLCASAPSFIPDAITRTKPFVSRASTAALLRRWGCVPTLPLSAARFPTCTALQSIDAFAQYLSGLEVRDVLRGKQYQRPSPEDATDSSTTKMQRIAAETTDLDVPAAGETRGHLLVSITFTASSTSRQASND